jgi:hypothetical protein
MALSSGSKKSTQSDSDSDSDDEVGDLKNIWLIDSGCSRHMTRDKGWFSLLKSRPSGDKEVHHFWGQWAWACAFRR